MKKSLAFQLQMLGIHFFLLKLSLLRDGAKAHLQPTDQARPMASFYDQATFKQEGTKSTSSSSLHAIARDAKLGGLSPFPGHCHHHLRGGPGQGKVWSRVLNVRMYVAAGGRWPVSFPLCLHHKAFRDHSCLLCGHLCVNFYSINVFATHLAFC